MTLQTKELEQNESPLYPEVGSCYGHAWNKMWKKFLELLLITFIAIVLSLPTAGLGYHEDIPWFIAIFFFGFSLMYSIFIFWPLEYGIAYAFLKAARGEDVQVTDIFEVFKNYINAILANILVGIIIIIGLICCIIPGIIFACKLAFVPYLIVDHKMDVIEAMKESWIRTTGHSMIIFIIGLLSIPILIAGLLVCCVGVLVSSMWIELTFAYMYLAVIGSQIVSNQEAVVQIDKDNT